MDYHEQVEAEWKMQKARERKQREMDLHNLDKVAEKEWLKFCFWCNGEHAITIPNTDGKIDVEQMKAKVYNNLQRTQTGAFLRWSDTIEPLTEGDRFKCRVSE